MLAPFLGKPLNVDDALFYLDRGHIAVAPLDPYGFDVNWYLTTMPMAGVTKNPPGATYLLAAAGLLLGWSHVAVALVFSSRRWGRGGNVGARPTVLVAALPGLASLVLASPGFSDVSRDGHERRADAGAFVASARARPCCGSA